MTNEILDDMKKIVSDELYKILKDSMLDLSLTKKEYEEKNKEKIKLQIAIKECIFQNWSAKVLVKENIRKIIESKYDLNNYNINEIINFECPSEIDNNMKFSVLLHHFEKQLKNEKELKPSMLYSEESFNLINESHYKNESLGIMISKYHLDDLKNVDGEERYVITEEEINEIYRKEKIQLSYEEKVDLIVQQIYSEYKGFGVIDELLEMNIDGINGGVSGKSFASYNDEHINSDYKAAGKYNASLRSIWIIYKGKNIHLKFLSFKNENELRRICENIYKYDSPGELSKSVGYKINKMKDGSRIVVIRPSLGESWMFFVRKFHITDMEIEKLITQKNCRYVIELLKYITKGCNNICISGQQGSGKTTMLLNLIEFIYPVYPIRISECSFELDVRRKFPNRNICTLQETEEVSGQRGLDLLKKTDGLINVIGEVASDEVASQLIQSCKVASKCTIFTHHAKSTGKLIKSLRNSLLKTGTFTSEQVAENEVASVIDFDVHLEKDFYGKRYVEKVCECIYDEEKDEYKIKELIRFENDEYKIINLISEEKTRKIFSELNNDDKLLFENFLKDAGGVIENEKASAI